MAKICQSHQLFQRVFVPRARSMVDTSGKEGGWEWNRCIKVTIYATIIQRVIEIGKGRMVTREFDGFSGIEGAAGIRELPFMQPSYKGSLNRGKHNGREFDGSSRIEGVAGIREFGPRRLVSRVHWGG